MQATGIAQTDLEAVGPLSSGRWAVLSVLFLAMVVYVLMAVRMYRLVTVRRDREGGPASAPVGAGSRQALS